jgi:O-antigen ligase
VVVRSRIQTGGSSTNPHTAVYGFIPKILHMHPLLGLGLNNFSIYYEFVTGKTDWGPHSFYVALIVETGLVGTIVFAVFLLYVFRRIAAVRGIGRTLARLGDPLAARVTPLGWGLTAALVGTMAANAFYLTMSFYYFYALLMLALAAPLVFGRLLRGADSG